MKIGNIWNKISKNDNRFLSFSLDKAFLELYRNLKAYRLLLFIFPKKKEKAINHLLIRFIWY